MWGESKISKISKIFVWSSEDERKKKTPSPSSVDVDAV